MFRKDVDTIRAWYPEKPAECAKIQKDIILRAADMLRPGGMMLYSTCTFAMEENEEVIRFLLEQRPDMELVKVPHREGFSEGLDGMEDCVRLWPHKMGGEGHFLAVLKKRGAGGCGMEPENSQEAGSCGRKSVKSGKNDRRAEARNKGKKGARAGSGEGAGRADLDKQQKAVMSSFLEELSWELALEQLEARNGQIYYVSPLLPRVSGIPFLRNGLYLGELKKDRFEPSQSFAMALRAEDYRAVLSLDYADERLKRYLRGETIEVEDGEAVCESGWQLVCVNGYPLGWGKLVNGLLKNKYLTGWRMK